MAPGTSVPTDAAVKLAFATRVEIQVLAGGLSGRTFSFVEPEALLLGRERGLSLTFTPADRQVSKRHAAITREGGGYVYRDLGSSNGSFLLPGGAEITEVALPLDTRVEILLGGGEGARCAVLLTRVVACGRYLLTGLLGRGGMAEVFAARQTGPGHFDRPAVLKLIRPETLTRLQAADEMLLEEARIAAQIAHPNVVSIYDVGEERGVLYIAMEHLRGVTLQDLLEQLRESAEPLPPDLAAYLAAQVCAGLHAAHELKTAEGQPVGVVHRDVSPSNVMLGPDGTVKVIDFGIARAEGRPALGSAGVAALPPPSQSGLKGKPTYMSPEQVRCEPLDRRSDVFSVGVLLYELCTGQRVFWRPTLQGVLYAVITDDPPPLAQACPAASRLLQQVVHAALQRDPALRPQTAAALQALLEQVAAEGGRFTGPQAVARYLSERGLRLHGRAPTPLTESSALPLSLLAAPAPFTAPSAATPARPGALHSAVTPARPPSGSAAAPASAAPASAAPAPAPSTPAPAPSTPAPPVAAPPPDPPADDPPPADGLLTVDLPAAGVTRELRTPGGALLCLRGLPEPTAREPLLLPLSLVPDLLPLPLSLVRVAGALQIEAGAPSHEAPGRRPGIYLDAHRPDSRCERFVVAQSGESACDIGHRRARVVRLRCLSTTGSGAERLHLDCPELGLRLRAPAGSTRLLALLVVAAPPGGAAYLDGVALAGAPRPSGMESG